MSANFSIPISIALLAFLVADGIEVLFKELLVGEFKWHNAVSIRERLTQLGKNSDEAYENFRIAQMTLVLISTSIALSLNLTGIISISVAAIFAIIGALLAILLTERNLSQRCQRRKVAIESEFPAIVEMLTLAVGAGESTATAFKRIATRAEGYLALEIQKVVGAIESGVAFNIALDQMSKRLNSEAVRRFSDSIIISSARGTSLVETLVHASNESRNLERVRLMTAAGKSEITMMTPIVFLVLPISILFALFPSLSNLNLFAN
jgi:tight adherence protein C